jgi:uncharacterized radical SAM superfamily Fe-S cluster-containing enzyme
MLIEETNAYCTDCRSSHKADFVVRDNYVFAVMHCPKAEREYCLSSNASMFLDFRKRSFTNIKGKPSDKLRYVLNYIPITDACNFNCIICGANAKNDLNEAVFLTADEVYRRALQIKQDGGFMINLTGGEPTLHPQLLEIVRRVSSAGLSTGINTNGYLLGRDDMLAVKLKQSGLNRVIIQFDALSEDILRRLRRDYLSEKRKAIVNAIDAGLRVGLNCTVTKHNLSELGGLLEHGLNLGSPVINIAFASAAPIGRYLISRNDAVDREEMVQQLLTIKEAYHLTFDDFLPLPTCLPWGIQVHPDCGVHVIFLRTPHLICPLNRYIDMKKLYQLLSQIGRETNFVNKYALPIFYIMRSIRKGQFLASMKIAFGFLLRRQGYSIVNAGLSNYYAAEFLDEQRTGRCTAAFYTSEGPVKGCLFAFLDENSPGSMRYEVTQSRL